MGRLATIEAVGPSPYPDQAPPPANAAPTETPRMLLSGDGLAIVEPGDDFGACADELATAYPHEFVVYPSIDPDSIEGAALGGFMPMAARLTDALSVLTPKLHLQRCVVPPRSARTGSTARRESSRYALSANLAFGEVLRGCVDKHGDDWLLPELRAGFEALHAERGSRKAAFVSFELWAADGGSLAAGEIGYLIGAAYASLSGFYSLPGAGTVQLAATAAALALAGIEVWDLGMEMDYKMRLGAAALPRPAFMRVLREAYARVARGGSGCPLDGVLPNGEARGARELIDAARSRLAR